MDNALDPEIQKLFNKVRVNPELQEFFNKSRVAQVSRDTKGKIDWFKQFAELWPTDFYFFKRYMKLSSQDLMREDIQEQRHPFVKAEAYLRIEDLRYLSTAIAIEDHPYVKDCILKRMKELKNGNH